MVKVSKIPGNGKFLEIFDKLNVKLDENGVLSEGKFMFSYMEYDKANGNKMKPESRHQHNVNADAARLLFDDIINYRFVPDQSPNAQPNTYLPVYDSWNGGVGKYSNHEEWPWASRHLVITYVPTTEKLGPCLLFAFELSEGVQAETGIIKRKQGAQVFKHSMYVPIATIRAAAITSLHYLQSMQTAFLAASWSQISAARNRTFDNNGNGNGNQQPQQTQQPQQQQPPQSAPPAQQSWGSGNENYDTDYDPFAAEA